MKEGKYLYQKIYRDIQESIKAGRRDTGESIPTAAELAKDYGVSMITANAALNALKDDGYIERIKGHGNFVLGRNIPEDPTVQPEREAGDGESGKTIGVVMEHVSSCFGLDYLYALNEAALKKGYRLLVRFSLGSRQRENEEIMFLKQKKVDGFICMPCHGIYYSTEILRLVLEKRPVILFDKQMKGIPVASVHTDNHEAMAALIRWLISRGRKKIGYVTVDDAYTSSVKARNYGFRENIQRFGLAEMPECRLSPSSELGVYSDCLDAQAGRQILEYIRANPDMDGLVFEEYGFLRQLPLSRTQLLSCIDACCVDEDYMSPGNCYITHVRQNERLLAEKTMEVLEKQFEGKSMMETTDYRIPGILCEANKSQEK